MPGMAARLNTLANRLWSLAPGARTPLPATGVRLVAHRGAHEGGAAIENTLAAFDLCAQHHVWGIELDVRLTRDLEPVIHHDPACGRLFGRPDLVIEQTDFVSLRAAVPEIPHLAEVVERYRGRMHLMLEIKESPDLRRQLPEVLATALSSLDPLDSYHLLSLEPAWLEGFRQVPPEAMVDVAWLNAGRIVRQNLALGHGAVAGSFMLLGPGRWARLRAEGKRVGTGFVETEGALRREAARGADWIFTDRILSLQPCLGSVSP